MCGDTQKSCGCIAELLKKILLLQKQDFDNCCHADCDKPFLGPISNTVCYNTRPITLYNCCTGESWSFPYTINDTTSESTVFRIESLDECCATCRILYYNTEEATYVGTNEFFTIDLNCVGAIKCHADTFIEIC